MPKSRDSLPIAHEAADIQSAEFSHPALQRFQLFISQIDNVEYSKTLTIAAYEEGINFLQSLHQQIDADPKLAEGIAQLLEQYWKDLSVKAKPPMGKFAARVKAKNEVQKQKYAVRLAQMKHDDPKYFNNFNAVFRIEEIVPTRAYVEEPLVSKEDINALQCDKKQLAHAAIFASRLKLGEAMAKVLFNRPGDASFLADFEQSRKDIPKDTQGPMAMAEIFDRLVLEKGYNPVELAG